MTDLFSNKVNNFRLLSNQHYLDEIDKLNRRIESLESERNDLKLTLIKATTLIKRLTYPSIVLAIYAFWAI